MGTPYKKKRVISNEFIADDFGVSASVNDAILHAHERGVLGGACLMMGQAQTSAAVELARKKPQLKIGLHFHLNDSTPTAHAAWPWGKSPAVAGMALGFFPEARRRMHREIEAQWALFQETGLSCAFANTHHHLHAHPAVFRSMVRTLRAGGFQGWLRLGEPRLFPGSRSGVGFALHRHFFRRHRARSPFPSPDTLWGVDRCRAMRPDEVRTAIMGLRTGVHEFIFHPTSPADHDTHCLLALR
jgi:hypothetical protein